MKGAVVLVSGPLGSAWNRAVRARGAAGVISSDVARVHQAGGDTRRAAVGEHPVRRSAASHLGSRRHRARRDGCARSSSKGAVTVHVEIAIDFPSPAQPHVGARDSRPLEARRAHRPRGARAGARRQRQRERMRHAAGRRAGDSPGDSERARCRAPARTLTFLWIDEIRGSQQWVKDDPARAKRVRGDDLARHDRRRHGQDRRHLSHREGPDPSAVWERPSDPHSEWGAGKVDPALVRGSFLNDLHLAVSSASRSRYRVGGADQSLRRRQRSHGVHHAPACRRCSTGTSPIATTTPISTRSTRRVAEEMRHVGDRRGDDGAVSGIGRRDRSGADDDVAGSGARRADGDRENE